MTRERIQRTLAELSINPEQIVFAITSEELLAVVAEEVDLETITNHELKEILSVIRKNLLRHNWQEIVTYSIAHLPFGLNQTEIAWNGSNPCIGCPDSMIDKGRCYHAGECKAWEIYEARIDIGTTGRVAQ